MKCKNCGGKLVMAGHRKTRKGTRQRYRCKNCGRRSVSAGDHFAHKTYPAKAIVSALTHYNLGHTLADYVKGDKQAIQAQVRPHDSPSMERSSGTSARSRKLGTKSSRSTAAYRDI